LVLHFKNIVDYSFTASVEKEFDEIAHGMKEWTEMIRSFYNPFHDGVKETLETAERATGERELGIDPESGKRITVRIGRYGPFVQIGENDEENKPRYASLRAGQMIESITIEEALELFKLPKKVGVFEDLDMTVAIGRFGPYIRHNNVFHSLPKEDDPHTVSEARAIEIILEKREKDANKIIKTFAENEEVKILNGRWGPYIGFGKQNVKIPKGTDPAELTYEMCVELAEKDAAAEKAGTKKKMPGKKVVTAAKTPAKKKPVAKKK
jgi:DNA topoisomerase-1